MASLEPSFRKDPDGSLTLKDSAEARFIKSQHRERDWATAKSAIVMRKEAEEMVKKAGGDVNNSKHLLGFFELQFGCFRGVTFKWLLQNSPGYAVFILAGMEKDQKKPTDNRWLNKMALKKYVELWPEGRKLVELKKKMTPSPRIPMVTATPEMSDDELLSVTQDVEQKMMTGNQTSSVSAVSSRELFVPTVSAQQKALLSGACLPVQRPSPVTATIRKTPIQPISSCETFDTCNDIRTACTY